MNNHKEWGKINISKRKCFSPKNLHSAMCQILMDQWKVTLTWHYHSSCKLVALELHNSRFYIVVIELNKLHMYMVSYTMGYIHCNSCNLFNSIRTYKILWVANELQMVITTKKPSCKVTWKSFFFIVIIELRWKQT
jgi:hypothetical protein